MAKKRVFISDIHIGLGRPENTPEKYKFGWDKFTEKDRSELIKFLKYLKDNYSREDEVILLGDIFDNWIFPHDMEPPSVSDIINHDINRGVKDALNSLSEKLSVSFIPGNHDMGATRDVINRNFPNFTYYPIEYRDGKLLAEHAHRYCLFNADANFSDNFNSLPLGYFLTRVAASKVAVTGRHGQSYLSFIDDIIEALGPQTLPQSVLEGVLEDAELPENINIKLKLKSGEIAEVNAKDVKERYKNIYEDWPEEHVSSLESVQAEMLILGPLADKVCKKQGLKVIVFGHNHKGQVDKDTLFCDDRIYANPGKWWGSKYSCVVVEKDSDNYTASLFKWSGGELILDASKTVS